MRAGLVWFNPLLIASAFLLACVNAFVWLWPVDDAVAKAGFVSSDIPRSSSPTPARPIKAASSVPEQPAFDWSRVESSEYPTYIANLRALGFPEELIREIVIADVNQLYSSRINVLMPPAVPFDVPVSQRPHGGSENDCERLKNLRDVLMEKQQVLQTLLSVPVRRELARLSNEINYDAYEHAIRSMPAEKQDAVQTIQEDLWIRLAQEKAQHPEGRVTLEAYSAACDARSAALSAVLTEGEFERFYMLSAPVGSELSRRTIGMEPTDEEMIQMYRIADDHWTRTGGVHGKWRARPVPPGEIAAADAEMNSRLEEALGPDRFLDYQMAISEMGQQLKNLGNRYNVSREALAEVFSVQKEIDRLRKFLRPPNRGLAEPVGLPSQHERLAELESRAQIALGAAVWQAWDEGRNTEYNLNPD